MVLRARATAHRSLRDIQEQLRYARLDADVGQKTLADQLNASVRTLRTWEYVAEAPSVVNLFNWARGLGFRVVVQDAQGPGEIAPLSIEGSDSWEVQELRRIAKRLVDKRLAHSWSQDDLALLLGVSRSSVVHWEAAETFPRSLALIAWAQRLKCTVALRIDESLAESADSTGR